MTPEQTDVERVARDLEHTGELSMPYRCEIADILRSFAGHTQHKTGLAEDARIMQKRIGSTPFPEGFQQIADDAHVMIARQAFRIADLEKRIAAMQPSVADALTVQDATLTAMRIERHGNEHDRLRDGWGLPPNAIVVLRSGNITCYLPILAEG